MFFLTDLIVIKWLPTVRQYVSWSIIYLMQCTTQRVYSERDLFNTLASMNTAHDHHNYELFERYIASSI